MVYKFEDELRKKAEEFINVLTQAGINVDPTPAMFRDYLVKIAVGRNGYINIYCDKNKAFSLKTHEVRDKGLASQIEACWNTAMNQGSDEAYSTPYQAYVDGSFLESFVGYGAVILASGQEVERFSGSVDQHIEQRQVVGELQATMLVLQWCQEHNVEEIEIFYDYEGIEKWATGDWKANNEMTRHYAAYVREVPTKVIWHKVKSHTGVHWNELVDELAKQGALSKVEFDDIEPQDPPEILKAKAIGFVEYLSNHDLSAEFKQIYNGQYARIVIDDGLFDLYYTPKRPLSPYLHAFKDRDLQVRVQELWDAYVTGSTQNENSHPAPRLEEVEYYLRIFEPYRHLAFDFTDLALALKKLVGDDIDVLAFYDDFDELEHIYNRIKTEQ
jgi:ribonuclease HI